LDQLPTLFQMSMQNNLSRIAEHHHALGLNAFGQGNLTLAVELFVKAIAADPCAGLYHRNLGELCRRLGRLEEAVLAGRQATRLTPQDIDAHANLGLALSDSGEWLAAIASYRQALALNPEHGLSWNNLGVALDRSGQRDQAEQAYSQAVALNPAHAEAQLNLGMIYKQQGRLEDARHCFMLARKATPDLARQLGVSVENTVASIAPPEVFVQDTASPRGRGVFAGRGFATGETVEACAVVLIQAAFDTLPQEIKTIAFNWGALCGVGTAHALALGYGALYNHHDAANLCYRADPENLALKFIAMRDIVANEELTVDYNAAGGKASSSGDDNWFDRMNVTQL
jgi:Flp pilus assembly protein TadD